MELDLMKAIEKNPEKTEQLILFSVTAVFMKIGKDLFTEMMATKALMNLIRVKPNEKTKTLLVLDHYSSGQILRHIVNSAIQEVIEDTSLDVGPPPDDDLADFMRETIKRIAKELRRLPRNDIIIDEPTDTGYKISCINPEYGG